MTRCCLVVEDESPLGEMICDNIAAAGWRAELCRDGASALDRLSNGGIDLVVLDIMLPRLNGFGVLEALRGRNDWTPVLVLSARSSDEDRIRGLQLQADDYLTKPFNLKELMLRIGALLRRSSSPESKPEQFALAGCSVDLPGHRIVDRDGTAHDLSDSITRLLQILYSRAGEVVSRREILDHVFGVDSNPSPRTLDNMTLALRRILESDSNRPRVLHTVRGVGLRLEKDS